MLVGDEDKASLPMTSCAFQIVYEFVLDVRERFVAEGEVGSRYLGRFALAAKDILPVVRAAERNLGVNILETI